MIVVIMVKKKKKKKKVITSLFFRGSDFKFLNGPLSLSDPSLRL